MEESTGLPAQLDDVRSTLMTKDAERFDFLPEPEPTANTEAAPSALPDFDLDDEEDGSSDEDAPPPGAAGGPGDGGWTHLPDFDDDETGKKVPEGLREQFKVRHTIAFS